jgi:hypothetical protein
MIRIALNRGAGPLSALSMLLASFVITSKLFVVCVAAFGWLLLSAPTHAQSSSSLQEPTSDVMALCTAWQLTVKALGVADELKTLATEHSERARTQLDECMARSDCDREERVNLEQQVRDSGYEHRKAIELAASMQERQKTIREKLEAVRGKEAIEKCEGI